MDVRRVHKVGTGSLAVTLPRRWVRAVGLSPGDTVAFHDESGAALTVTAPNAPAHGPPRAVIDAPVGASARDLERLLIAAYLGGSHEIEARPADAFTDEQLHALRAALSRLTGFAVVESRPETFLATCYLDPAEGDLTGQVDRLLGLTQAMVRMGTPVFGDLDARAAREILALGDQADRLYYLTVRFLVAAVADRSLAVRMRLESPQEAMGACLVAKALEEIGDSMETLAEIVLQAQGQPVRFATSPHLRLAAFSDRICDQIGTAVDAFFAGSTADAARVLEVIHEMEHGKEVFVSEVLALTRDPVSAAVAAGGGMALRDVCRFTRVIAETAMNNAQRRRLDKAGD